MLRSSLRAVLLCGVLWWNASATPEELGGNAAPDPRELRQLYADYNAALLNREGRKAASLVHGNILRDYGEALAMARHATREEMQRVPARQRLVAFYLRWAATTEELAQMHEPHDVMAYLVSKGALRSDAGMSSDLRNFEFKQNEAFASLYAGGRNTNVRVRFGPEGGTWKIDLADLNAMAEDIYAQSAALQKVSVDQALFRLVQSASGRPVTEEIWIPLERRAVSSTRWP